MKKIISLVVSAAMLISVLCFATSAFAAGVVSPEHTTEENQIVTEVNGNESDDVKVTKDPDDPTKITFEYTGDGDLQGWEFPGMKEGKDYIILYEDGNKITIQLINGYKGKVIANAIVKNASSKKKKSGDKKSPKTGASAAAAVAVAGAGIAILAAARKKNEE